MPSNTNHRPKIPAQHSSQIYHSQLHLQDPHLYPSSNPYSLHPRHDFVSYSHPTNPKPNNPNTTTNTRPTAPTIRSDLAPPSKQKSSSPPSDAALFWSFVSRQIQKQKAKSRAKKEKATTSSTPGPTARPIPIVYPSSTSTAPPLKSPQQPYSLFRDYRRQQKERKTRARKALISAPLKGGVTVVRTDSGNEYSFPEPRAEAGVVRVLRSRGGTKRGRGVVMPTASSKVAGLREMEKRAVRRVPSGRGAGLGIDLGEGKLGSSRAKGDRGTRWGDFLGKSSAERESERQRERRANCSPPTAKTVSDTYSDRTERCRICHEIPRPKTKESRSSGVCGRCRSEYSSPYTPPFSLADNFPPVPHLKDSRLYTKPSPRTSTPKPTSSPSEHPDTLFADFDSSPPYTHPKYQLSPFEFETDSQSYDSRTPNDERQSLLPTPNSTGTATRPTTKRRGAVSAASPVTQSRSRKAPPIPDDDEYTSRKYGTSRKGKGGKEDKRRSSFYNFWDEVLAGSRTSLAARRGYDVL